MRARSTIGALAAAGCCLWLAACAGTAPQQAPQAAPSAGAGAAWIEAYGCGACHTIAGIDGATGRVGPSLEHFVDRLTIGGRLPNTPENAVRWIRDPQRVDPGTLMPDLDVGEQQARAIVDYLRAH